MSNKEDLTRKESDGGFEGVSEFTPRDDLAGHGHPGGTGVTYRWKMDKGERGMGCE